jgi:ADP-ribosyl-[dinitrogen reductase] hydrolase
MKKTSEEYPLRIDYVEAPSGGGLIGMTFCPGKKQAVAMSGGAWDRDLDVDVAALRAWGAEWLVTHLEYHEVVDLAVEELGPKCICAGIGWIQLPIVDGRAPDERFAKRWRLVGPKIHETLDRGGRIVIHCKGGLGRTGVTAVILLVERGLPVEDAMRQVRAARKGAIETIEQEDFLRSLIPN